jgi:tRNA dimethylallyltransferase
VPPIPADIRAAVRARLAQDGAAALHAELQRHDARAAARLNVNDRTRIARALEVVEATGRSILDWQTDGVPALLEADIPRVFIAPERATLYARIDARFKSMLAAGALDEVRWLAARGLDPLLPAMKAHGVPWLIRHLAGEITLEAAAHRAKLDTRHYAKRQFTWFRHQLGDWPRMPPEAALEALLGEVGR